MKHKLTIVAIIGSDGCGKTTQANMLVNKLNNKGYKAIYVRPIFIILNMLTSKDNLDKISPRKIRVAQVNNKIIFLQRICMSLLGYPYALVTYILMKFYFGRNKIVVCDRYFYQFLFDIYGNWSKNIIDILPRPDITFFINTDLDILYTHMNVEFDVYVGKYYYMQIINLCADLSKKYGFIEINGNLNKDKINDLIFSRINNCLTR